MILPSFLTPARKAAPSLLTAAQRHEISRRNQLATEVHCAMHQLPKEDVLVAIQQAMTRSDWSVADLQDVMLAAMEKRDALRGTEGML